MKKEEGLTVEIKLAQAESLIARWDRDGGLSYRELARVHIDIYNGAENQRFQLET